MVGDPKVLKWNTRGPAGWGGTRGDLRPTDQPQMGASNLGGGTTNCQLGEAAGRVQETRASWPVLPNHFIPGQ